MRGTTGAFDHMKNPLCVGDTVSVVQGMHNGKTGTIKHINRSVLWLHSNSYLKNSSIFVVKGKSCILAGSQQKDSASTTAAVLNATYDTNPVVARGVTSSRRAGAKDDMIGKSVKLGKGSYKGMLGHIVDSTETHFWVELHGRLKKIYVEKEKVQVVGDKHGAVNEEGAPLNLAPDHLGVPSTPFLTAQTPMHVVETPMYGGGETPAGNATPSGNATPGRDGEAFDVWKPSALDVVDPAAALHAASSVGAASGSGWGGSGWSTGGDYRPPSHMSDSSAVKPEGWGGGSGWGGSDGNSSGWRGGSSAEVNHRDWDRDMLVVLKGLTRRGETGVLLDGLRQDGTFDVRIVSGRGDEVMSVPASDLSLLAPRRKDTVKIISGPRRGLVGKVQSVEENDVFVSGDMFRVSQVACLSNY
ncbi:Spt5 [Symbiodinium microadriaticum]|nr:Spt5 [Symbiodinium microadriaticum]